MTATGLRSSRRRGWKKTMTRPLHPHETEDERTGQLCLFVVV